MNVSNNNTPRNNEKFTAFHPQTRNRLACIYNENENVYTFANGATSENPDGLLAVIDNGKGIYK